MSTIELWRKSFKYSFIKLRIFFEYSILDNPVWFSTAGGGYLARGVKFILVGVWLTGSVVPLKKMGSCFLPFFAILIFYRLLNNANYNKLLFCSGCNLRYHRLILHFHFLSFLKGKRQYLTLFFSSCIETQSFIWLGAIKKTAIGIYHSLDLKACSHYVSVSLLTFELR